MRATVVGTGQGPKTLLQRETTRTMNTAEPPPGEAPHLARGVPNGELELLALLRHVEHFYFEVHACKRMLADQAYERQLGRREG